MKKLILFISLCPTILFGQNSFQIGGEFGLPNGNFANGATTGFGGTLCFEVPISDYFSFIATIDYISFGKKEYTASTPSGTMRLSLKVSTLPIQVGGKFYLLHVHETQEGLYVSGELGIQVLTGTVKYNGVNESPPNETDFCYAPGIGYRFTHWDINYRQQFATSNGYSGNYSGLRIAYIFQKK